MSEELKPCHQCASDNIDVIDDDYETLILCVDCGYYLSAEAVGIEKTKKSWNTRPVEEALRVEIDRLNKILNLTLESGVASVKKLREENAKLRAENEHLKVGCYFKKYQDIKAALKKALPDDPYLENDVYCYRCGGNKFDDVHTPDCPWLAAGELLEED